MNDDLSQNNNEFKTLGMTMEKFSIIYSLFLIVWGIIISLLSKSSSITSYIPSILGFPILFMTFFDFL